MPLKLVWNQFPPEVINLDLHTICFLKYWDEVEGLHRKLDNNCMM